MSYKDTFNLVENRLSEDAVLKAKHDALNNLRRIPRCYVVDVDGLKGFCETHYVVGCEKLQGYSMWVVSVMEIQYRCCDGVVGRFWTGFCWSVLFGDMMEAEIACWCCKDCAEHVVAKGCRVLYYTKGNGSTRCDFCSGVCGVGSDVLVVSLTQWYFREQQRLQD